MISDDLLLHIIKTAEVQAEREVGTSSRKRNFASSIDGALAEPFINYLLEPYENGYWELKAEWNSISPISEYLLNKLKTLEDLGLDGKNLPSLYLTGKFLSDEKRNELLEVTHRVSAINALFKAAWNSEHSVIDKNADNNLKWISNIDLENLRTTFTNAYTAFSQHIYLDNFNPYWDTTTLSQTKEGALILLEGPINRNLLSIVAMGYSELSNLRNFYRTLGVIKNDTLQRIFAPDEALFKPYFTLASCVLQNLIRDSKISHDLIPALAYYEEEDFQHCISSLGLIAEGYIQRVYTTLLREPLPGNHTLGQIFERLSHRIENCIPLPKIALKDVDCAYELIKNLQTTPDSTALAPVLRELVQIIISDRQYFNKRIDELSKPVNRPTVFPKKVHDALNELLKWRNAASHNSRVPLGAYEADRTLFCLIILINWWQKQLTTLDWTKSRDEIINILMTATHA
ncbi:hypothetical protein [Nitrosomonas oligotropha]|uniref:Uncharacterized protein n=1 Tax=Nitrosomonas oligotropha TaxID=42354 RepID=A0A1H8RM31_9PROT|nr:hypothetical protein [Nitrosomonas oligotropha]SDX02925.1 hypothetical protein SAMN05216300_1163 [Nitrosomonas oligotropha]SEO67327.1 hypothetical protein SAMN05216333_1153 [Nitrosomonas oligotropha]